MVFFISISITSAQNADFKEIIVTEPVCIYHPDPNPYFGDNISKLRKQVNLSKVACSNFNVIYIGFESKPEAQAAFQHAVDIWSHIIESPVEITIVAKFEQLEKNTLGSASPASFRTTTGVRDIDPTKWYPLALYEKLLGQDTGEIDQSVDINTRFNSDFNFYFGTDGNPPSGQYDFVTIVLHELGHGLGFVGFGQIDGTTGSIRSNNRASVYDSFVENGNGVSILDFTDPSQNLFSEFTSNNLFSNSPMATSQNNGIKPKIYAPSEFEQGSSYSHWDEGTFLAGTANSLMTPQVANGESNHAPGPITLGLFENMGWSICSTLSIEDVTSLSNIDVWPNPFNDNISIRINNLNSTKLTIKIVDMKGSQLYSKKVDYDGNNILRIDNIGNLQTGVYFMTISDNETGAIFTKKLIK